MIPEIKHIEGIKLIGKKLKMSVLQNKTELLWRSFMPFRKEIINRVSSDLYSVQVFEADFDFEKFDIERDFEKWATAPVSDFDFIPAGMESLIIPKGMYAVFIHKGPANDGPKTFRYIFGEWLPGSIYEIDNRPHFEILGEKYKNNEPDSEEEIWIPVRVKSQA